MFTPVQIQTCKHFLNNTTHLATGFNFWGNISILSVFFREKHKILPYLWINLKKYLEENVESEVTDIPGNRYCFLSSVVEVLRTNYGDIVTQEQLTQCVMKFLCLNYEKYFRTLLTSSQTKITIKTP